jgi:hypothetical protein
MIKSGFSSQYEVESSKNHDSDVTKKVMEDFSQVLKQQAAFFNKCKVALLPMPNMLTKIYLDSNGLQGSDLSIILEGLQS